MFKEIAQKIFSNVFLFIFFAKMAISVAPVFFGNMDEKSVYSVIMQLEIDHQLPKESESKELAAKGDWFHYFQQYNFSQSLVDVIKSKAFGFEADHVQSFYPPVPTPPPNV
jgi:hypothetical protein